MQEEFCFVSQLQRKGTCSSTHSIRYLSGIGATPQLTATRPPYRHSPLFFRAGDPHRYRTRSKPSVVEFDNEFQVKFRFSQRLHCEKRKEYLLFTWRDFTLLNQLLFHFVCLSIELKSTTDQTACSLQKESVRSLLFAFIQSHLTACLPSSLLLFSKSV